MIKKGIYKFFPFNVYYTGIKPERLCGMNDPKAFREKDKTSNRVLIQEWAGISIVLVIPCRAHSIAIVGQKPKSPAHCRITKKK